MDISRYLAKSGEKSIWPNGRRPAMWISTRKSQRRTAGPDDYGNAGFTGKLFADNHYGLVIVLQAMDAAGKDGTVKHVFARLNPAGVKVQSFKKPSSEEMDHDYMWRINKALPGREKSASSTAPITKKSSSPASTTSSRATACRKNWSARISGRAAIARYATGNGTCRKMAFLWSRYSFICRKRTEETPDRPHRDQAEELEVRHVRY